MKTNYKDKKRAQQRQRERLEKRIKNIISTCKDAYFLTFTFTDRTMESTTEQTRLRYIKNYLNEQASEYVLNCDYGVRNEREHYHAIIKPKHKIIILSKYKYGYLKAEKLFMLQRYNIKDADLLSKFLSDHATKETTKNSRIIYSRTLRKHYRFKYKQEADQILNDFKESDKGQSRLHAIKQWRKDHNLKP